MLELRLRRAGRDASCSRAACVTLCAMLVALATPASAQIVTMKYVVNDLGNLAGQDGASVSAWALNEAGQVVGQSVTAGGQTHAYRTAPNRAIKPADDLGTLGGAFSAAYAINNAGQVAGDADTALAGPFNSVVRRAFRLDPGSPMIDLGTLAPNGGANGFNNSGARGINDAGVVVGHATVPADACGSASQAFRTAPNSPINPAFDRLGTLVPAPYANCRSSIAWAVGGAGLVVGDSATVVSTGVPNHAFRWAPATGLIDLGTLGGRDSQAFAVNDRGEIVGQSLVPLDPTGNPFNSPRAFLSQGSLVPRMIDLGTLGGTYSSASGINSRDPYDSQIVGASSTAGDAALRAFLWTGNLLNGGVMVDLNTRIAPDTGWQLVSARSINNKGQIIGTAWRTGVPFVGYAVRLDPSDVAVDVLKASLSDAAYGLTLGQVNSLGDKLTNATVSIQQGLFKQAVNQLNAFVNAVQVAVANGKMSVSAGSALVAGANAIIATLN